MKNNPKTVTVTLDEDTLAIFTKAAEIVAQAGIRIPIPQLVQIMLNAEGMKLSPFKVAQRFLRTLVQQVSDLRGTALDDEEDDKLPNLKPAAAKA